MATIGISGLGSIGARHARVFGDLPGVRVVAQDPAADADEIRRRTGPDVVVADGFDQLLDRAPDGIVLASPDSAHVDQVLAATGRGIPVLVEKPLAANLPEGLRLSADPGVPVLVGYVLRHYRCMTATAGMIADGRIGTPVSFHVDLGAYETLRLARNRFRHAPDGTIYADYSHEWHYLRWWLGDIVAGCAVEHIVDGLPLVQRPNVVDALLRMSAGLTGSVHLDYVQDPGHRRIAVIGDEGTITVDVGTGSVALARRGHAAARVGDHAEPRDHAFGAQARHFLAVVRGESAPAVTVSDGLAALAAADALRRSATLGRWQDVVVPGADRAR